MNTCVCMHAHIHTHTHTTGSTTCMDPMLNTPAGLSLLISFRSLYTCPLAAVTFGHRHPPLLISNGKWVIALVEDEGENGLSGSFVSAG